jgi:hypothetical protein
MSREEGIPREEGIRSAAALIAPDHQAIGALTGTLSRPGINAEVHDRMEHLVEPQTNGGIEPSTAPWSTAGPSAGCSSASQPPRGTAGMAARVRPSSAPHRDRQPPTVTRLTNLAGQYS